MSSERVLQIMQDSEGFLWYATEGGGLCRDNGRQITVFRSDAEHPDLLGSNDVSCVAEASEQFIIIGTFHGAYVMDKHDYSIRRLTEVDDKRVDDILISKKTGHWWITANKKIYEFDDKGTLLATLPISDKYIMKSVNEHSDEIGIYRTSVVFTPQDLDRALYLETSGICGSFDVYLNGQLITESHAVMTRKRILLSDSARPGTNQLAIAVYRWDRERFGHVLKELMTFGFSGIIRPVRIVAEPLLEISNLHLNVSSVPDAYVDQLDIINTSSDSRALTVKKETGVTKGNFSVTADFRVRNHTDLIMPYQLSVSLMEALRTVTSTPLP